MDIQSWNRVVDEIGPRLHRYFKYKGAGDQASDLTQETFIRLVDKMHKFDSGKGPLIAFAIGIAQNVWRENFRKLKNADHTIKYMTSIDGLDQHEQLMADTDLHAQLEKFDQAEKLRAIVLCLSQVQQDILYFYFDEEITTREIADILQIPEGTVKSHLHRAKETIRMVFEKERLWV